MREELKKLVGPTRQEPGCITYDLHASNENPAVSIFYELWQTQESWERHMKTPHVEKFKATALSQTGRFEVHQLRKV